MLIRKLDAQPHKGRDHHLAVWAYNVAVVLEDTLKLRPTATRTSNVLVNGSRGGAAYARLLDAARPMVISHSVDLDRVLKKGLQLLKDPRGDSA